MNEPLPYKRKKRDTFLRFALEIDYTWQIGLRDVNSIYQGNSALLQSQQGTQTILHVLFVLKVIFNLKKYDEINKDECIFGLFIQLTFLFQSFK